MEETIFLINSLKPSKKKSWEKKIEVETKPVPTTPLTTIEKLNNSNKKEDPNYKFSTQRAGISGIISTTQKKLEQEKENLTQAFSDLESLMENADKMVKLARKFKEEQNKKEGDNNNSDDIFLSMGVVSSITK